MSLILSQADYWELLNTPEPIQQNSNFDKFDITRKFPSILGEGYHRQFHLRDKILLDIHNYQFHRPVTLAWPERKHPIEFQFSLLFGSLSKKTPFGTGKYFLSSSGMAPESNESSGDLLRKIYVHINPEIFRSFARDTSGELHPQLQHLIKPWNQTVYERFSSQTLAMQVVVQQILQCPYQGFTKQMYLETKVWELATLVIEQELQIHESSFQVKAPKPLDIERIYYAREILLQNLDKPPSLLELARQVGLNDYKLKVGFRTVFGTTVFGYLHHYRMELAQKLLLEGNMNVTEVAIKVGYVSLSSFIHAFRKQFGVSPKSCHK